MKSSDKSMSSIAVFLCFLIFGFCYAPTFSNARDSWGQKLAVQGIDTNSVDQLRAILKQSNDHPNYEVLMYLIDQPKVQLVEDIAPYIGNSLGMLRLAAAGALLQVGDTRGAMALDSVVQSNTRSNPGGLPSQALRQLQYDEKISAISLFSKRGTFEYCDTLIAAFKWCARYGYIGVDLFRAVRDYGARASYADRVGSDVKNAYLFVNSENRTRVLELLSELATPASLEFLLNVLKSDASVQSRSAALMYLARSPSANFEAYVFGDARNEQDPTLRKQLYNYIRDLGTPASMWALKQLVSTESDADVRWSLEFWLSRFKVKPTLQFAPISTILDSLRSFQQQCFEIGWLSDGSLNSELAADLMSARQGLASGDSMTCARAVRLFQNRVDMVYKDSLSSPTQRVTYEGWRFLHTTGQYILARLPQIPPSPTIISLSPSSAIVGNSSFTLNVKGMSFLSSSVVLWNGSSRSTTFIADSMLQATIPASDLSTARTLSVAVVNPGNDTSNRLTFTITHPSGGLNVKLINGTGVNLIGGSLQYYDGSWKDATNNNDGTFSVTTSLHSLSLRMTYEGGSQTKSNVTVGPDMVIFQTVSAQVKLQNSLGVLMDTGAVQYYAGSWRSFGTTSGGIASKELLPGNYSFRMIYGGGSKDLQQNIGTNPVVVFQTVSATVLLKNSQGSLVDHGTVQYYAGAWRAFGTTSSGSVSKELLPISYSFRMTTEGVANDKTQDISTNSTVNFSTVLCTVSVKNSQGQPVSNAIVSYYAGAWKQIGPTVNGLVTKELLPANLTFRMVLGTTSQDKVQNIGTNSLVEFVVQS